jgi:hypothetical protein
MNEQHQTNKQIAEILLHHASQAPNSIDRRFSCSFGAFTVTCNNNQQAIAEMANKFLKAPAMLESYGARDTRLESTRDYTRREPRNRLAERYPEETFL